MKGSDIHATNVTMKGNIDMILNAISKSLTKILDLNAMNVNTLVPQDQVCQRISKECTWVYGIHVVNAIMSQHNQVH